MGTLGIALVGAGIILLYWTWNGERIGDKLPSTPGARGDSGLAPDAGSGFGAGGGGGGSW